jgi:hypothetical protein
MSWKENSPIRAVQGEQKKLSKASKANLSVLQYFVMVGVRLAYTSSPNA